MKRIDSVNARPDMFGVGKSGFHANDDVPGQDATYLTPDFLNTLQEEIANLLELRGITLDPEKRTLLQVKYSNSTKAKSKKDQDLIQILMGDEVAPRKDFIIHRALEVSNLDI